MTCTRGTTNTNARGSSSDRRARKLWLLSADAGFGGDGKTVPCYRCRVRLTFDALTVDRQLAGILGGTYARPNTRPACSPCNILGGNEIRELIRRAVLFVPDRMPWHAYVEAAA